MDGPIGPLTDWLAGVADGVDWGRVLLVVLTGIGVGVVAFAAAVGAAYWVRHTDAADGASRTAAALARGGLLRLRRASGTADRDRWLCGRCRSWNPAGARACYKGCGRREDVKMLLPGEVPRAPTGPDDVGGAGDGAGADRDLGPPGVDGQG